MKIFRKTVKQIGSDLIILRVFSVLKNNFSSSWSEEQLHIEWGERKGGGINPVTYIRMYRDNRKLLTGSYFIEPG